MIRRLLSVGIVLLAFVSHAYVLNVDGAGNYLHWDLFAPTFGVSTNVVNLNTHAVRYFLASDAYSTTNTTAELNAVRAAFGQWMAVSNSYIRFEEGGLASPPMDVNSGDDTNIVYWTKSTTLVNGGLDDIGGSLGVTFTTWQLPDMSLLHADIVFNGYNYTWFTDINDPTTSQQLVDGVALHEIGHMLGLNHSPLGGATMFWRGASGVNSQAGLHADDFAGVRFLYPTNNSYYGAIKGTVLKDGSPVLGAIITAYDSGTNGMFSTLSHADGTYELSKLPSGAYRLRVTPLDDYVSTRLCAGPDVDFNEFGSPDTMFLPGDWTLTTVSVGIANTVDFNVVNAAPSWRISRIVRPTTDTPPSSFNYSGVPVQLRAGQSNYYVGVAWSPSVATNGSRLIVPGDGLTTGSPIFYSNGTLNFMFASLKISSNATPGLRDFIVSNATTYAYAPGYLTILPTVTDDNFDGLDDNFQRTYWAPFTSTNAAPGSDPDGDSFNNYAEYISGTVPTNSASFLKVVGVTPTGGGTTVRWLGSTGKRYQVSSRSNLTSAVWQNIGSVQTVTNYLDATPTNTSRYYRVQALP